MSHDLLIELLQITEEEKTILEQRTKVSKEL